MQSSVYIAGCGLLLFGSSLLLSLPVQAQDYDELDERLRTIEAQMPEASGAGMPGMVGDIQRLQQEVRELRGEIERLQYEHEQANLRQRDMNLDIEKRLSALEQGNKAATGQKQPPASPDATSGGGSDTVTDPVDLPESSQGQGEPAQPGSDEADASTVVLNEQDEYLKAFELLKQGSYDEAVTAFQGFLENFPSGTYTDNARYWLAETYYVKKDYATALTHFEQLLAQHPNSSKLPGALLKIGYIQYETGNYAEARLALERVRNEFSGSNVADLATQRLQRMDREGR